MHNFEGIDNFLSNLAFKWTIAAFYQNVSYFGRCKIRLEF